MPRSKCYRCDAEGVTREHFPPKAFFPKGGNLQLKTVKSCPEHNTKKSSDDQYVLAHICMHASRGENLAGIRFRESIVPQLDASPKFKALLGDGSRTSGDGKREYRVDIERFNNFFDCLCSAIFFDRYSIACSEQDFAIMHHYLSFETEDETERRRKELAKAMHQKFFSDWEHLVSSYVADKVDEVVYGYDVMDPMGSNASITIVHSFYGAFQVVSLLTHRATRAFLERIAEADSQEEK